ncbi:MAG: sulfatase-like hydrolase/transferase [Synergistota bacterium]|nr:sulfatase-like hydrolase/transferase [Synergistota bacterium]
MSALGIRKILVRCGFGFTICLILNFVLGPDVTVPLLGIFNASRGTADAAAATAKGYNIIFILVDQERYMGPVYPAGTDFNARERLKTMGTTFEKHYTCSNMSTSSRSVIYTGKHITDTKMFDNIEMNYIESMDPGITTIGDMMRKAGYYTAYKGKLHIAGNGVNETSDDEIDTTDDLEVYGFSDWNSNGDTPGGLQEGYTTDPAIAEDAIKWLQSTGIEKNERGQPFFLAVNLVNPHDIMYFNTDAPGENIQDTGSLGMEIKRAPDNTLYEAQYPDAPISSTYDEPFNASGRVQAHGEFYKIWGTQVGYIPAEADNWERFRDYYYNCIKDNDSEVVKILDKLDALGLTDKTIIVMTSDHGELQGDHHMNGKGNNMYENNIHVPLIIYHPDAIGDRVVSTDKITSHLDLATTFVNMTKASDSDKAAITKGLPGKNLLPLLRKNTYREWSGNNSRKYALVACSLLSVIDTSVTDYTKAPLNSEKRGIVRGIITQDGYKFTRYFKPKGFNKPETIYDLFANNDVEIFDMKNDQEELHNIADDLRISSPKVLMELNAELNAAVANEIGEDTGREFSRISENTSDRSGSCSTGIISLTLIFLATIPLFIGKKKS